jgi:uncharacterized protein DUF11
MPALSRIPLLAATLLFAAASQAQSITALSVKSDTPGLGNPPFEATLADATFTTSITGGSGITVHVQKGASSVDLAFAAPFGAPPEIGPHEEAVDAGVPGASPALSVGSTLGHACTGQGRFVVHELAIDPSTGNVARFAVTFDKWCAAGAPIYGELRINSTVAPSPAAADTTPDPFDLFAPSPVRAGAIVQSNVIGITGIGQSVPITITDGEYSLNGAPFTFASGVANLHDRIVVRVVASPVPGSVRNATLTVGGRSATLSVVTYAPGNVLTGLRISGASGEFISGGRSRLMLVPPNRLTPDPVSLRGAHIAVDATGGSSWDLSIFAPNGAVLQPGTYAQTVASPGNPDLSPILDLSGEGRACDHADDQFTVHEFVLDGLGNLERFAADFTQQCDNPPSSQLSGEVRFGSTAPFSALVGGACLDAEPDCIADLAVTQQVSGALVAGSEMTFTVTVTNHGSATAHNVTLTSALDAPFVRANGGCVLQSGTVVCMLDSLANGASAIYSIVYMPGTPGSRTHVANVSAFEADPLPSSNTSELAVAVQPGASRLGNISTRGRVLTGSDVMIGGFVIGGATEKTVVVTAIGPSLTAAGITNPLFNPTLTLVRSSDGAVIATNDDWGTAPNAAQIQAAGFAPGHPRESAVMMTLPPGAYTAIVAGAGSTTGVAIVAVYEVDHPETPLVNISTRGRVLTGNDVMIGGFIVQGSGPRTVVVTGIGPSLIAAGIANPLANPTLTLVRSADNSVLATNDDWGRAPNAAQIQAAGFAPANPAESAIMIALDPGAYTAILSGVGTTGVGIIAVYTLP